MVPSQLPTCNRWANLREATSQRWSVGSDIPLYLHSDLFLWFLFIPTRQSRCITCKDVSESGGQRCETASPQCCSLVARRWHNRKENWVRMIATLQAANYGQMWDMLSIEELIWPNCLVLAIRVQKIPFILTGWLKARCVPLQLLVIYSCWCSVETRHLVKKCFSKWCFCYYAIKSLYMWLFQGTISVRAMTSQKCPASWMLILMLSSRKSIDTW